MYRVAYIDDEIENIHTLQRKTKTQDVKIVGFEPKETINELVMDIVESGVSAVVVDYNLQVTMPHIKYNGVDFVEALEQHYLNFPTFILTAYDSSAEAELVDVNKIYDKNEYFSEAQNTEHLTRKIKRQIENYHQRIRIAEEQLIALKEKAQLEPEEETKMLELDEFLEKSIFRKSLLPADLKRASSLEKLEQLVKTASEILEEVKKKA